MKRSFARWGGPLLVVGLFVLAIWGGLRELAPYRLDEIRAAFESTPWSSALLAMVLTAASFVLLSIIDWVAARSLGHRLAFRRIGFAAAVAYAFSHTIGLFALTGASVRYRFFSRWGLTMKDVGRLALTTTTVYWLGFAAAGSLFFWFQPQLRVLAALLGLLLAVVAALAIWRRRHPFLVFRGHRFELPPSGALAAQVLLSAADWAVSAMVLYFLLPAPRLEPASFIALFLIAQVVGALSQVPGGLGVFESVALMLLGQSHPTPAVAAALVIYRLVYYLLPLVLAATSLGVYETATRWPRLRSTCRWIGKRMAQITPLALTITTFVSGVVLLVSGATPAEATRIAWLRDLVPLPVVELSHLAGSLSGAGLILLSRGLQLRLDAAYTLTALLLAVGATVSLVKGVDYEEALFLVAMLLLLLPCRRHFDRRAALTANSFTAGWVVAVVLVLSGTAYLSLFAHKHVEYGSQLWWRFAFNADAPRSLRALVGVIGMVAVIAASRLLRPTPIDAEFPMQAELDRIEPIVASSPETMANLALLGDKALLQSASTRSFLMYAVEGRSFVALGDPVGAPEEAVELVWQFCRLADQHGGWPVFYQVSTARLPLYLDVGLSLVKIGEEGRVALADFSLAGKHAKRFRHALNLQHRRGCTFLVEPPERVPALMPELREVSESWLSAKNTREKGFSLGTFDESYLRRFPLATVRQGEALVAFANVWAGESREELSVDLMRFADEAPEGSMEALLLETMLWGKALGYRWFNLGMAPLSGLVARPEGPLLGRLGSFVFQHGEHFYNFQGLRHFKEKFDPQWQPRYLAYPGAIRLPRVLLNIATLTSGGLRGVVGK